ncbi:MAG: hypothetical protein LBU60_00115 [Clostridiales bacterium]|jgi:hypothetical protein|nr:hypothetical protein [Clostridiales bacterium]
MFHVIEQKIYLGCYFVFVVMLSDNKRNTILYVVIGGRGSDRQSESSGLQ